MLIQSADLIGVYGLSFTIALVNAFLVSIIRQFLNAPTPAGKAISRGMMARFAVVLILIGGIVGYGAVRVRTANFRPGPRLALLQSNLTQELKMARRGEAIVQTYIRLIDRALEQNSAPDLIVWPETAFPYKFITIDPTLSGEALKSLVHKVTPQGNRGRLDARAARGE